MSLSDYAQLMLPAIETELQNAAMYGRLDAWDELYSMIFYHMGWEGDGAGPDARGKRLRPLMVTLTAAAACDEWLPALPAAAAVEMVHNFSLIHDDIEDNSPLRRGRPTVWAKWGIPQAINVGDTLFTLAHLAILRLEQTSPSSALASARLLQETCLKLTQGQYLDIHYEKRTDLTLEGYWLMVGGKTAALLECCAGLGAMISGIEVSRQKQFREFARCVGLAFQARDDLLGIWGDAELTGKSAESDLVAGKNSLPVLFGLQNIKEFAQRWASGPVQPDEVSRIASLLDMGGAREFTQQSADRFTLQAIAALDAAEPQGPAGEALSELANILLSRSN